MKKSELNNMNTATLAYMGDAIYEQAVRQRLIEDGGRRVDRLQKTAAKKYVSAQAQAEIVLALYEDLDEEEQAYINRWKNYKPRSMPRNGSPKEYRWATAFEAFVGYLYLSGDVERLEWVMEKAFAFAEDR